MSVRAVRGLKTGAAIAGALLAAAASAAAEDFSGRIRLTLEGALHVGYKKGAAPDSRPLNIYLTREKGAWVDGWAETQRFNRAIHEATVTGAELSADKLHLELSVGISSDAWIKGGPATYVVDLQRKGEAAEGTFSGVFTGTPPSDPFEAKGRAVAEILPPQPVAADWVPFQIGEHPRMLCRKNQLPQLRARAKTPFGQAVLEKIKASQDPVCLGFMYQMTEDKGYADRAFTATVATMDNRNGGPFALGRFWGYRTSVVGTAYDLCYDAWTPEQRDEVENYLDWILYKCLYRGHRVGTVNWAPGSNYTVVIHAGNGMGALALWGEKGDGPVEPIPPRTEFTTLRPPAGFTPGKGVPVVKPEPGRAILDWLYLGPFKARVLQHVHPWYDYKARFDCLEAAGGEAKVQPAEGQKVTFHRQTLAWQPLNPKVSPQALGEEKNSAGKTGFNTTRLSGDRENTWHYFYTVLELAKPGFYQLNANQYEGRCVLAGERFNHGEIVQLEAGRYPLLLPVALPDGEYRAYFRLTEATEAQARAFYANPDRQKDYERYRKEYENELAQWNAAGERNTNWMRFSDAYRHWCYLCLQLGMGDGGFQSEGEGYTLECHHVLHDYACMYQNAFGRSLTGRPDISHFGPRYVFMSIDGPGGIFQQSFGGHGGGTAPPRYLSRSIALCPKEWQPAVLWHWLKLTKVSAEEVESGSGADKVLGGEREGLDLVEAFVNYPLGMKPQNPGDLMPHVWYAQTKGLAAFRNAWDGTDSIVAQFYAKQTTAGWNQAEAGSFLVYGLGCGWAQKDNGAIGKEGSRWLDNATMLPDDPFNAWGRAKVTYFQGDPKTGSGVATMNLDDVYRGVAEKGDAQTDLGIRGLRSFGVDFSAKAGAPALIAVVDKITGGKRKIWVHQLPGGAEFSVAGNAFTLKSGDASYQATVVSPANAKIVKARGAGAQKASKAPDADRDAIHVTGPAGTEGDFFVVITIQKGAAPAVKAGGSGLNSRVNVGGQTVSFDGEKIVFGK